MLRASDEFKKFERKSNIVDGIGCVPKHDRARDSVSPALPLLVPLLINAIYFERSCTFRYLDGNKIRFISSETFRHSKALKQL